MSLKDLLGEELFQKVEEKLDEDTKLIINDGSYIPKEKFDEKNEKVSILEEQIKSRDEQIEQLKNDTNATEELQGKIEELQKQNEQTKEELSSKLQKQKLESEIDKALLSNKARNTKAVKALLDMDKVELTDDGVKGLNEQLESMREEESYLFEIEQKQSKAGEDYKGSDGEGTFTMADIDNMSDDEINENWEEISKVLSNSKK